MEAYITHIVILIGIYSILTMGQNITLGYTGLFALAQAAFYGIGAYTSALFALKLGIPFWGGLVAAALIASFFGWVLGFCTLRLGGDYFAMATLGFVEIIRELFLNWEGLTRGAFGLPGIPRPHVFGFSFDSRFSYCILLWIFVFALCILMKNISESRVGRAFKAIRDNETAALAMGINTFQVKVLSITLGAFYGGIGGAFYAHYIRYIDPSSFSIMETIIILCMAVLGGMGSIAGSIFGAAGLVIIPELLRMIGVTGALSIHRQLLYGAFLVAAILFRPQGIMGKAEFRLQALIKGGPFIKRI
jgi:branched-chain amino acid transport system permease protein